MSGGGRGGIQRYTHTTPCDFEEDDSATDSQYLWCRHADVAEIEAQLARIAAERDHLQALLRRSLTFAEAWENSGADRDGEAAQFLADARAAIGPEDKDMEHG